jgi:hypothetical protein
VRKIEHHRVGGSYALYIINRCLCIYVSLRSATLRLAPLRLAPLRYAMKKTVVVDMDYMRPSVGGRRSRSRSRSRSTPACDEEELNVYELLQKHKDAAYADADADADDATDDDATDDDHDGTGDEDTTATDETSEPSDVSRTHPSVKDSDYAVDSDEDLFQSVLDEPTFPMDINAILSAMNKTENNTIANLTLKKIAARRHEILSSMNLTPEKMAEFERKLMLYRVIENPNDLKHNQLIRWIPLRSLETRPYLTLGGTLFRVRENEEDGIHVITIRNVKRFVFNIMFELNVVFQRLSQEEMLILRAVEYVEGDGDGEGEGESVNDEISNSFSIW